MYIASVPNRGSPPAILLRESYREGGHVKTRTLANLSKLPADAIGLLQRHLKGEKLVPVGDAFEVLDSPHHGHVEAVLLTMQRLGFFNLLASSSSRKRDLAIATVASRILEPDSKLATTRWWHITTLPSILGVANADEDDVYEAMDWLLERQERIERKLAARHLQNDGLVLYDLTSSYFEGITCPLAALGHNRDGKKGKLQVNYGLLTNADGIPVSVSVYKGNTGDPKTLLPQVEKARTAFGIQRLVMVGDRGMITQKQINALRKIDGVDWIAALRPEAIKKLIQAGTIQMGLFDERNFFEVTHPDFPGERLIACRNLKLAQRRRDKRTSLLEATAKELERVRQMVGRGRLQGKEQIGEQVRKVLRKYKIGKCYQARIREDGLDVDVDQEKLSAEDASDVGVNADAARKRRQRHMDVIAKQLDRLRERIRGGQLHGKDEIGVRVGKVVNKHKVSKHFKLDIQDDRFEFQIDQASVAAEAALDGIYVVRTALSQQVISAEDTVRSYKLLSQVERAFRSFKTIDLQVRPIHHHLARRVRAHIFLCMLAYYVQWHMLEAWRSLLFSDEDLETKAKRDPVAPAQRSAAAERKASSKTLEDGSEVHGFQTLLKLLSKIVRNTCRVPTAGPEVATFEITTTPNAKQQQAYDLLKSIKV